MAEKTYINGAFIKSNPYGLKASFSKAALEQMLSLVDDKGYCRVEIKQRREADKAGNTHYIQVDDWTPNPDHLKDNSPNIRPEADEPSDLTF